ncbi:MAG: hypothetical protein O3C54_06180 [Proteobacteria bacterium]|nr:hypothetical protein [Pseudomonadota bacterium]
MSSSRSYYSRPVLDAYKQYSYIAEDLSNTDLSFLAAAAKIATTSAYRFRMGALLVKSGRVLAGDVNVPKISPSTPPNRVSTHAEIRTIKNTRNVRGATLYVARLRSKDFPALAKPCAWCLQEIMKAGISRVVFTTNHSHGSSFYTDMITWRDAHESTS